MQDDTIPTVENVVGDQGAITTPNPEEVEVQEEDDLDDFTFEGDDSGDWEKDDE